MNKIELLKKELKMTRDENIRKDIEEAIKCEEEKLSTERLDK